MLKCEEYLIFFISLKMLVFTLCKVLLKSNINMLGFAFEKFAYLSIYLNLRGHNESAEEQVPHGSQPAEGKCCFLQL